MSKMQEDEISALLQDGLRQAAVPTPAADFDDRVRERLRRPEPWWQAFVMALRPIAAPAACSLAVTLALLIVMGLPKPAGSSSPGAQGMSNVALEPTDHAPSIDQELDRLDRDIPSLNGFRRKQHTGVREEDRQEPPILHRGTSYRRPDRDNRV